MHSSSILERLSQSCSVIPNDRRTTLELNKRTFKQQEDALKIGKQLTDLEGFRLVMEKTTKARGSHKNVKI